MLDRSSPASSSTWLGVTFAPHGPTCVLFAFLPHQGLGKTLQTLMLVLSNPPPAGWAVKRLDGLTASEDSEAVPIKTSLIVVPANLLGQVGGLLQWAGDRWSCFALAGWSMVPGAAREDAALLYLLALLRWLLQALLTHVQRAIVCSLPPCSGTVG